MSLERIGKVLARCFAPRPPAEAQERVDAELAAEGAPSEWRRRCALHDQARELARREAEKTR